jgi:primary-amine oxidase
MQDMSNARCGTPVEASLPQAKHPLEPLTPDEIRQAAQIVKAIAPYGSKTCFETIALKEPSKAELKAAYESGQPVERRAHVNASSAGTIGVTKFVSFDTGKTISREDFPDEL